MKGGQSMNGAIECSRCGALFAWDVRLVGQKVECIYCHTPLKIPDTDPTTPSSPIPAPATPSLTGESAQQAKPSPSEPAVPEKPLIRLSPVSAANVPSAPSPPTSIGRADVRKAVVGVPSASASAQARPAAAMSPQPELHAALHGPTATLGPNERRLLIAGSSLAGLGFLPLVLVFVGVRHNLLMILAEFAVLLGAGLVLWSLRARPAIGLGLAGAISTVLIVVCGLMPSSSATPSAGQKTTARAVHPVDGASPAQPEPGPSGRPVTLWNPRKAGDEFAVDYRVDGPPLAYGQRYAWVIGDEKQQFETTYQPYQLHGRGTLRARIPGNLGEPGKDVRMFFEVADAGSAERQLASNSVSLESTSSASRASEREPASNAVAASPFQPPPPTVQESGQRPPDSPADTTTDETGDMPIEDDHTWGGGVFLSVNEAMRRPSRASFVLVGFMVFWSAAYVLLAGFEWESWFLRPLALVWIVLENRWGETAARLIHVVYGVGGFVLGLALVYQGLHVPGAPLLPRLHVDLAGVLAHQEPPGMNSDRGDAGAGLTQGPALPRVTTTELCGGSGGSPFQLVSTEGEAVIGLAYALGDRVGQPALRLLQPVFARGTPEPPRSDSSPETRPQMARDGYALSGLAVEARECVVAVRPIFMRLRDGQLDPQDSYQGDWIGTPSGRPAYVLGNSGRKVLGIHGRKSTILDAVGLMLE